ncbi:uncharacterized protein [Antedon mediterranea]|uniref:uncharacterized protein n=1 Tax=Antedon mediterranea TaxID=105859 RepID=UPI003AF7954E
MGKTTLFRYITYNWANDNDDTFSSKVLFLLNIRDIETGKTIIDSIVDQINLVKFANGMKKISKQNPKELIETFIIENEDEIVLLLDGLDELEQGSEERLQLLKFGSNYKTTTLITSRPENITTFVESCDVHVEVNGFSKKSVNKYIRKYFNKKHKLGENLISELKLNLYHLDSNNFYTKAIGLIELCSSPLLLLMICSIWEESGDLPIYLLDLFKELICCTINQFLSKGSSGVNRTRIANFDRIPIKYKTALLALGQCMYEGLKTNVLIIDKYEFTNLFEDESIVDLALKIGFVYKKPPLSKRDRKELFAPPHKLVSEALTGFYLADKCQSGDLKEEECEMIRSNTYLHMTIIFTIGFLGAGAGRLMKHWLKVKASSLYSLAKYFRYVKEQHEDSVIEELDATLLNVDKEVKETFSDMSESFRNFLSIDANKTQKYKNEHLVQLMSRYQVKCDYQYQYLDVFLSSILSKLIQTKAIKPTEKFCAMLVHLFIIAHGVMKDKDTAYFFMDDVLFQFHSLVKDEAIDILSVVMDNFQFQYNFAKVSFHKSYSLKFMIHLLKYSSKNLIYLKFPSDSVKLRKLLVDNILPHDLHLGLEATDLSDIDTDLLFKLVNHTSDFKFTAYNLTVDHLSCLVDVCYEQDMILTWKRLNLSGLYLSSFEVSKLAYLITFSPKLQNLDMNNCHLSGNIIKDLLRECDKNNVVLKRNMFNLMGNDLSNIDGVSLFRLVNLTYVDKRYVDKDTYNWHDYSLSIDNLNGLIDAYMHGNYRLLTWKMLNLSELNLSSIEGSKLAYLLFSSKLEKIDMRYCQLSGSIIKDLLNECDKNNVVLKPGMLDLRENNLSDIDGVTLFKLVTINSYSYYTFDWHDYNLSIDNLQSLLDICCEHCKVLTWKSLSIRGLNLSSFGGSKIACLLQLSPQLNYLDMKNCQISGSIIKDFLNECDTNKVALKPKMFDLKGNNLSHIDGVTLLKLVNLIRNNNTNTFDWHEYNLSIDNLQSLLDTGCEHDLDISECHLSGSILKELLN